MEGDSFLYFGYASNMLKSRLHLNTPTAELIAPAKLQGYRLCFRIAPGWTLEGSEWRGATGTLVPDPDKYVWGAVWRINNSDLEHLEPAASTCPPMTVTTPEGKEYTCLTYLYLPTIPLEDFLPSPHYMKVIVEGAIETGVPASYVDFLKKIEHNGDTTTPPIMAGLF